MDSISIIPGGNTGDVTEDTGVVVDNPNTPAIEMGAFLTRTGSIEFADADTGPAIFHVPYATPIGATLGTLRVNIFNDATGGADTGFVDWTYAVDNTLVQYLAAGETRVESFDLLIVGYDGEEQHTTISVTLTGTNDAVVISSPAATANLSEDGALTNAGTFLFNDIDTLDTHTASVAVNVSGNTTGLTLTPTALAALLSTTVTSTTTATNGSVAYNFTGSNADFQYLWTGETLTLTYTITVSDGHGSTANQTVTVNIAGSDDMPTITSATTQGGIIEAGALGAGVGTVSGDASNGGANWIDLDHGDDATLAITQGSFGAATQVALSFNGAGAGANAGEATLAGAYGTLYLKADGTYRYVLDNASTATQALDDGAAPNEIFHYTILSDDAFTATSTISINVAGSNDAPVLSAITSPAAFTEAANASAQVITASGTFNATDVDGNDTLTPVVSGAVVRLNGNVINSGFPAALISALNISPADANSASGALNTFNWAYAPGAANLDFLSVTDTLTITYPVSVSDGTTASSTQNIVITINGTNDLPAISLSLGDAYTGSVTETNAGGLIVSDTFTVTDLDLNDAVTGSILGVSATGFTNGLSSAALQSMFTITTGDLTAPGSNNGLLTWTFNSGAQTFDFLNVGETLSLDYNVQVSDGHGGTATQVVTVSVNGTNDAPTVTSTIYNNNIVYIGAGDTYNSIANAYAITGGYSLDANPEIYNSTTVPHISFYVQSDAIAEYFSFTYPNFAYASPNQLLVIDVDSALGSPNAFLTGYYNGAFNFDNDNQSSASFDAIINAFDPALRIQGNGNGGVLSFRVGTSASSGALGLGSTYILNFSNPAYTGPLGSTGPGVVVESNAALTATGAITFADVDHGDVVTATYVAASDAVVTSVGATLTPAQILDIKNAFSVTSVGAFTFSLASPDYLAFGETVTAVYTVHGTDTHGGATTQNVTYTIVGTNDAPIFTSGPATATLGEDAVLSASGTLAFNDVDVSDVHTLSPLTVIASGTGNNAGLTLSNAQLLALLTTSVTSTTALSTGSVGYSFAGTNPAFQYLRNGQTLTLTYTIGVNDGHGGTASQTVTINVTGSNDGPIAVADVNGTDVVIESGIDAMGAPYAGDPTATGNLLTNDTDLDFGDTQTVTTTGTFVGIYGSIVIASDGTYTYTLNNGDATTNALAVGATATDIFNYTMSDTFGATSSSTITITLTGTNDAPAFSGAAVTASFTEDASLLTSGTLNFNDVDVTDVHSRAVAVAATGTTSGLNLSNAQLLALFTSSVTSTTTSAAGSVAWSFAGSNPAFQYLATGESVVLTYSVTVDDGHGGTASKDVTVTVTGLNDAPVITAGGASTGSAAEALNGNTTVNLSGSFAVTDVDLSNNLTLSEGATNIVWSGGTLPVAVTNALTAPGAFVISDSNAASNAATVDWTLAPGALDLNFLAAGETIIVTVPVTVSDGFGGSATQNVVVTVTGTNDVPVITGGGDTGSITEVAGITGPGATSPASLTGDFTVADADQNGTTTITSTFGGFVSNYGPRSVLPTGVAAALAAGLTFSPIVGNDGTITWTYSVPNSAVDFLIEGEILTATINVNVNDGAGGIAVTTVAITITGTNDAVQAGVVNLTGAWTEGAPAAPAITGTINYTDADFQNHGLQTINTNTGTLVGAGGTFTASNAANSALDDGAGAVVWSYTLAPGAADYLAVGQTATEVFRVRIIDGAGFNLDQNVTVTITGTNDAPVISSPAYSTTQNEDAPPAFSSGTFLFNDVDITDVHSASVALVASGDIGGLTASNATLLAYLNTTVVSTNTASSGSVTYNWTPNNAPFQYLQVGQTLTLTYTITVADGNGGTAAQTVTVNISGSNDGPVAVMDNNASDVVIEAGFGVVGDGVAAGNVLTNDTDADFGDTAAVAGVVAGASAGPIATGAGNVITGTYGTITIASNGSYTYTLNNADADTQALDTGNTALDVFSYTVVDSQGATSTNTVTISVSGTNDAPVIAAITQPIAVVEAVNASAQDLLVTGSFSVTDVDANDILTPSVAAPIVLLNGVAFGGAPAALLAALSITPGTANSSSGAAQTFNYTYDPAAANLDFLNVGETLTIRYPVTVGDGTTSSVSQFIDITITGTNDAPDVTGSSAFTVPLMESNSTLTTGGPLAYSDRDTGDVVTLVYNPAVDAAITSTGPTLTAAQLSAIASAFSVAGTGSGGTGAFSLASPDYLATGEVITAVYTVHGNDTHGGTTPRSVTITITGTNDGPVFTSGPASATFGEDAALSAAGTLNFNDVDVSDVHSLAPLAVVASGSGNTAGLALSNAQLLTLLTTSVTSTAAVSTGTVGYSFTGSNPAFQYLNAGETLTLTYSIGINDGHSGTAAQTVTINITGSNDAPTITAATSASGLAEDGTLIATGDASLGGANWNDVDFGQDATLAITQGSAGAAAQAALTFNGLGLGAAANEATIAGAYGTLYLRADGTYRYVLNNASTAAQALDSGQTASDVFHYTISDGATGSATSTITANIAGNNDAATITTVDRVDVTESNGTALVSFLVAGQVTITDVDTLDAANPQYYIAESGEISGTGPNPLVGNVNDLVTFDAVTGQVSYDRAAFNYLGASQDVTYTVSFFAQSGDDDPIPQSLTFTITGQNDLPVLVADTGTLAENVGGTFNVLGNDSDVDLSDALLLTGVALTSVVGLGSLTASESADIANDFTIVGNQLVFTPAAGLPGAQAVYDRLSPGQTATIVVTYSVSDGSSTATSTFTLTLTGAAENFEGTPLDDNPFNGSNFDDIMHGNNGDDVIFGNSGNDVLYGDQGNDTLNGGSGNDSLYGGPGSDNLIGGSDIDTAFMEGTWASYTIAAGVIPGTYTLTRGGEVDTLTTIELVSFNGGAPVAIATILNDAPVVTGATYSLTENVAGPVILGTITATDADTPLGDVIAFSITGGNEAGHFAIDAATGVVSLASGQTLDREISASYGLTVTATDIHGATGTALVTINVGDVNDNNPVFSSGTTGNVNENAVPATVVYDANASDADATFGAIVYTLGGTDAAAFNIDSATGEVRLNTSADYEVRTSYAITVTATQGATATTQAVSVTVNDLNDNVPVFSSGVTASINENAPATTVVYDANATDADASFGPIVYTLTGADAAAFNIDAATGEVRLNTSADYEVRTSYAISVVATQGITSTSRAVTVNVTDVNDNVPVFSSGTTASVNENAPAASTIVYDANATDADVSFGPISYSLTGADAAAFNIDAATGEVRLNASADYEVRTSYAINVVATQGATATTQAVSVTVNDLNDNVPVFSSGVTASINENAPATTVVYDANATDADISFGPIVYTLTGADAAAFNIDAATGEVRLNASADYEVRTSYAINVVATQGTTATSRGVTVSVNDLNDNAPVFSSGTTASVNENAPAASTIVYDANATDADLSFGPISYSLTGADAAAFNIDAATGEVRLNASADYEVRASYAINVVATQGSTSTSRAVSVSVNDLNDNVPVFSSGTTASVNENAPTSTVVYDANATDADASFGPITYTLGGADAAAFNIDGVTGEVRLNASANYEVRTSYAINVIATQGSTSTTRAVAVSINDLNDNNPVFSSGASASIAENAAATTVVYDANATDADPTFGPIVYSLTGADAAAFNIDGATGEVRLNSSANYEVRNSYAISVVATQGATATTQAVSVSVSDVNEFAVGAVAFAGGNVNEIAAIGTVVGSASAVDQDGTASVSYSLDNNAGGRFAINATTGQITVANGILLDFEQSPAHNITVRATSSDGSTSVGTSAITLNNISPEVVVGTDASETVIGGAGNDIFMLNGGNDYVRAGGGNDILNGGAGSDRLIGGMGNDTAVYSGALAGSGTSIIRGANGVIIVNDGLGNVDMLRGIEQIQFSDTTISPTAYARSDVQGDGTSDIITYSDSTGLITRTNILSGAQTGAGTLGNLGSGNWDIQATGDFNYDGTSDLVLKNAVTGQFYVWTVTNGVQTGGFNIGTIGVNWNILSTGDFNRDGNHDVLWRNNDDGHLYVWTFDAAGHQTGGSSLGVLGTNWTGAGVGDFNGDGTSDVLLRNADNGRLYVYTLNGGQLSGGYDLNTFGTDWVVGGVGDFNGDGISDIALKNNVSGQFYILQSDTAGSYTGSNLGIIGTNFNIASVGDYNHDGVDDILLRNSVTNQVTIMAMEDGHQAATGSGVIGAYASDLIIV